MKQTKPIAICVEGVKIVYNGLKWENYSLANEVRKTKVSIIEERKTFVEIFLRLRMVLVSIFVIKTSSFQLVVLVSDKNAPLTVWNIGIM